MKKTILVLGCLFMSLYGYSQQFHMEVFSGYNIPNYDHPQYETDDFAQSGFSPIGIRIAGGHEYVQLGFEYRQNLTDPEFEFDNFPGVTNTYKETYYGGLIRINISSLPVYRAGIVIKAGGGYYNYTQEFTSLGNTISYDFDKKLGFNGGIGLLAPIYANLHLELGYSYHFIDRDEVSLETFAANGTAPPPGWEGYKAGYHAIQAGLSINLMVTEKGKAGCQNKRHRSKGKHGRGGWFSK